MNTDVRVLTWNLFHGRDGGGLGPTPGSTFLRRGVSDGRLLHLNRKWIDEMAGVIAARNPTIAALQEVPPLAVSRIAELTGMHAVRSLMPPLIGSVRLRGRLAERNPDLWRTHEGTANVLLTAHPWTVVDHWTVRHNPPSFVTRNIRRLGLDRREALHWLLEPRRLVGATLHGPDGERLTAVSLHCHDHRDPKSIAEEVRYVLPRVMERVSNGEGLIIAGDMNARGRAHPAIAEVLGAGVFETSVEELGIDHIFHRDVAVIDGPRIVPATVREHQVDWRGSRRVVLLSDHDIVEATYRVNA